MELHTWTTSCKIETFPFFLFLFLFHPCSWPIWSRYISIPLSLPLYWSSFPNAFHFSVKIPRASPAGLRSRTRTLRITRKEVLYFIETFFSLGNAPVGCGRNKNPFCSRVATDILLLLWKLEATFLSHFFLPIAHLLSRFTLSSDQ